MFTAWLSSCVSCFRSQEDHAGDGPRPGIYRRATVEREMRVCHSQPHLVPPMKLVFFDDLPSPGPTHSTSRLPSWVIEGKNLASRASNRASILLRRSTQKRPVISAPSEFRRVDPPASRQRGYRPLELSIYMPGNRLSNLPNFEEFGANDMSGLPSMPARALASPYESWTARRHQSAPHYLARKPVGSRSSRGSLGTGENMFEHARRPASMNPLIPHFSTLLTEPISVIRRLSNHLRSKSEPATVEPTPPTSTLSSPFDKLLPSTPVRETVWPTSFPSTGSSPKEIEGYQESHTTSHSPGTLYSVHERAESNSTSPSSTLTSRTGRHHTFTSISSATTAATTFQMSLSDSSSICKDIGALPSSFFAGKVPPDPKTTAVYEGEEPMNQPASPGYEYDSRFPHSNVGLAF